MSATAPLVALLAIFLIVFATIAFVVHRFQSRPVRVAALVTALATLVGALVPVTRILLEPPPEPETDLVRLVVLVAIFLIVFATIAFAVDRLKSTPARVVAVIVGIGTLVGSMVPITRLLTEPVAPPVAVHATVTAARTDAGAGQP
ncbi:hypothetical protein ABZ383_26355 [Streptomyces sp. NPDC005900]|uniref:hypothetical protein n=1 Tax=unclassified Streptomyces TaxID=2593676 RepID=UPI0033F97982